MSRNVILSNTRWLLAAALSLAATVSRAQQPGEVIRRSAEYSAQANWNGSDQKRASRRRRGNRPDGSTHRPNRGRSNGGRRESCPPLSPCADWKRGSIGLAIGLTS